MGERKKRRLEARAARAEKVKGFTASILSAIIADLIAEAIKKWLMR
jgi:hypothetical protein